MAVAEQPILRRLLTSISGTLTALQEVTLAAGSNVTLTTTRSGNRHTITIASTGGGGGGGAPTSAQYVTLATDGTLTAERVLTAGHGVDLADAGAGSTITVDVDETELDHAALGSGMGWAASGHTGTASRLAGFGVGGAATYYQIGVDVQAYSSTLAAVAGGTYSVSGDLSGTLPSPTVTQARGLRETAGPTTLTMGAVSDGQYLQRSGSTIVGVTLAVIVGIRPTAGLDTPITGGDSYVDVAAGNTTSYIDATVP
jgi:hypothetical protein